MHPTGYTFPPSTAHFILFFSLFKATILLSFSSFAVTRITAQDVEHITHVLIEQVFMKKKIRRMVRIYLKNHPFYDLIGSIMLVSGSYLDFPFFSLSDYSKTYYFKHIVFVILYFLMYLISM